MAELETFKSNYAKELSNSTTNDNEAAERLLHTTAQENAITINNHALNQNDKVTGIVSQFTVDVPTNNGGETTKTDTSFNMATLLAVCTKEVLGGACTPGAEVHRRVTSQYGGSNLPHRSVNECDKERAGRKSTSTTDEKIQQACLATFKLLDPLIHTSPCSGWVTEQVSQQFGISNSWLLFTFGSIVLLALTWALLFTLVHVEVAPGGDLFKLLVLILLAYITGRVVALVSLPPLLGMLLAGIFLRSIGFFRISGIYLEVIITLRELALCVILIKAGLGLDAPALLKLSFVVIRLAFCPCIMEAVAAAVVSHFLLGYPWLWGLLLGFMLSAVSPAVVVPTLLSLQEKGYGEEKGIATLVIAASSLDDIVSISVFGVCLGMIFTQGDLTHQLLQGPFELAIGLSFGIFWGLLAAVIPHREDKYVVWKRTLMVGGGGLCAMLGSELVGFSGAGPLAAITASFVACLCWKLQGWPSSRNPVQNVFSQFWYVMQPILFGLIGAEIDLRILELNTVGYALVVLAGGLVIRVITCCGVLVGGNLNLKEVIFVNLAWLPKATVQAALGPEALDMVRREAKPRPEEMLWATQILTIAVISILITAPLGSIGISIFGPKLLSNEPTSAKKDEEVAGTASVTEIDRNNRK